MFPDESGFQEHLDGGLKVQHGVLEVTRVRLPVVLAQVLEGAEEEVHPVADGSEVQVRAMMGSLPPPTLGVLLSPVRQTGHAEPPRCSF